MLAQSAAPREESPRDGAREGKAEIPKAQQWMPRKRTVRHFCIIFSCTIVSLFVALAVVTCLILYDVEALTRSSLSVERVRIAAGPAGDPTLRVSLTTDLECQLHATQIKVEGAHCEIRLTDGTLLGAVELNNKPSIAGVSHFTIEATVIPKPQPLRNAIASAHSGSSLGNKEGRVLVAECAVDSTLVLWSSLRVPAPMNYTLLVLRDTGDSAEVANDGTNLHSSFSLAHGLRVDLTSLINIPDDIMKTIMKTSDNDKHRTALDRARADWPAERCLVLPLHRPHLSLACTTQATGLSDTISSDTSPT